MPYEFKDPLWPEPEPDLWRGGRPLAPYRPPKLPPPTEPKPTEYGPWFPEEGLEPQPKADPKTGQPVTPQNVASISRASQAQAGVQNLARMVDAWKRWRLAQVPTSEQVAQGNIPVMPAGIVVNSEHGLAKLVARMMPKAYRFLEQSPTKVKFAWLPPHAEEEAVGVGETAITPAKEVLLSILKPADALHLSKTFPTPEQQAAFWHAYNTAVPHEVGHTLDALKFARQSGTPALVKVRVTPNTIEAAERIMAADPNAAEAFKGNVAHYFSTIQQNLPIGNDVAMKMAEELAYNELLVQSGAEAVARRVLKPTK